MSGFFRTMAKISNFPDYAFRFEIEKDRLERNGVMHCRESGNSYANVFKAFDIMILNICGYAVMTYFIMIE